MIDRLLSWAVAVGMAAIGVWMIINFDQFLFRGAGTLMILWAGRMSVESNKSL